MFIVLPMEKNKGSSKSVLPAREQGICSRVKEFRTWTRNSQDTFAKFIGIKRATLASYENLRAPLRYPLAVRMFRNFDMNQRWLATGRGIPFGCVMLKPSISDGEIKYNALFSEVYDRHMSEEMEEIYAKSESDPRHFSIEFASDEAGKAYFRYLVDQCLNRVTEGRWNSFAKAFESFCESDLRIHEHGKVPQILKASEREERSNTQS
jgi:DNA-binding XRE family transcriptional regulator